MQNKTIDYKNYFKNKKITVMGLGILGRGLGYTKFLAECGAILTVTDLKTKEQLQTSIKELEKYIKPAKGRAGIKFVLGEHRLEDFRNRDMIIKAAGVPLDSIYIKEAGKNNPRLGGASTPIEMDVSLFAKCAPEVTLVGVTGTRGKSMTTALIYEILKKNEKFFPAKDGTRKPKIYLGGNVRGVATLPLLKKVKAGDILVCELDSWQLQGFGDAKVSPHISVFTSFMPDHMNYYKNSMKDYLNDKINIFKYQKNEDILIIRPDMKKLISKDVKSKLVVVNAKDVTNYKFIVPGEHQRENLACAAEVAKQFKISESKIKKAVENFKGLEGRLQYVKTVKGVKIYNDNNATTPEATIAGIEALTFPDTWCPGTRTPGVREEKHVILICGGSDKKLPLDNFIKAINKHCKAVFLIPGTGTDRLLSSSKVESYKVHKVKDLNEAVKNAQGEALRGDTILFSPAFASFGMFNNEYERNDLFMKIVKKLK
ncbi:MAG: UDP-N-acetylmuramoyl-L-alanine--D-glutamate ligase [Candidatus Paceibacterota bacterium]|jgi:UDP-N-acetylmuramoylalanine--D-glutamate ligase